MHSQILFDYTLLLVKELKNVEEQLKSSDPNSYRVFDGVPERLWDETSGKKCWECDFYQEVSTWLDAWDNNEERRSMLYWFEIDANHNPKEVLSKFWKFKTEKPDFRVPALKKNASLNESHILYVGKKQWGKFKLDGRIYTHLGYNDKRYPGLQLHHWAKGIPFKLHIWVANIERESYPLLEAFEKRLAAHFRPLIGKHI